MRLGPVVAAALLAGCAHVTAGQAQSEPPATPPNLDAFTAVDPLRYYIPLRGGPSHQFSTAAGIGCEVTLGALWCFSPLGSERDGGCARVGPTNEGRSAPPYTYTEDHDEKTCFDQSSRTRLDDGRKVSVKLWPEGTVTCAASTGWLACVDDREGHGFVLSPTASRTF